MLINWEKSKMRVVAPARGGNQSTSKRNEKMVVEVVATRRRECNLWNINPSRSVAVASRQRATQRSGARFQRRGRFDRT
jgi:hypothetical protein